MKILNKLSFLILISWSIFISVGCFTNSGLYSTDLTNKHRVTHQNRLEPGSKLIKARVHYSYELTTDGRYVYKQYYPERQVKTIEATYMGKQQLILHGDYQSWSEHGGKNMQGTYRNNRREGIWKDFRAEGEYSTGKYLNDKKVGDWVAYDKAGNKTEVVPFVANQKHGIAQYFKNNELVKTERYEYDELLATKVLIPDPDEPEVTEYKKGAEGEMPRWKNADCEKKDVEQRKECSQRKMLEFVYRNIRYPSYCRTEDIQGTGVVRFKIKEDGTVDDIVAVIGISADIERELIRVVSLMPKWIPGNLDGKPVEVYFNLPIKFRLE